MADTTVCICMYMCVCIYRRMPHTSFSVDLLMCRLLPLVLCDELGGWDEGNGRGEVQESGNTHIADSLPCSAETNTVL